MEDEIPADLEPEEAAEAESEAGADREATVRRPISTSPELDVLIPAVEYDLLGAILTGGATRDGESLISP